MGKNGVLFASAIGQAWGAHLRLALAAGVLGRWRVSRPSCSGWQRSAQLASNISCSDARVLMFVL